MKQTTDPVGNQTFPLPEHEISNDLTQEEANMPNFDWLNHSSINASWVCEQLYGNKDKKTTAKFFKKLHGKFGHRQQGFTEEEVKKLDEIKKKLLIELLSAD